MVFVLDTGNLLRQTAVLDKHPAQGNSNTSSGIMRWRLARIKCITGKPC